MKELYIRFMAPVVPQTAEILFKIIDSEKKNKYRKNKSIDYLLQGVQSSMDYLYIIFKRCSKLKYLHIILEV